MPSLLILSLLGSLCAPRVLSFRSTVSPGNEREEDASSRTTTTLPPSLSTTRRGPQLPLSPELARPAPINIQVDHVEQETARVSQTAAALEQTLNSSSEDSVSRDGLEDNAAGSSGAAHAPAGAALSRPERCAAATEHDAPAPRRASPSSNGELCEELEHQTGASPIPALDEGEALRGSSSWRPGAASLTPERSTSLSELNQQASGSESELPSRGGTEYAESLGTESAELLEGGSQVGTDYAESQWTSQDRWYAESEGGSSDWDYNGGQTPDQDGATPRAADFSSDEDSTFSPTRREEDADTPTASWLSRGYGTQLGGPLLTRELSKSEVITPEPISPTFGYTKEKPPHDVGSWFRRLVGGASWETSLGGVSWEGGRGRPYYSSGPSPGGGLGGRLPGPGGPRWTCLPEREWGCGCIVRGSACCPAERRTKASWSKYRPRIVPGPRLPVVPSPIFGGRGVEWFAGAGAAAGVRCGVRRCGRGPPCRPQPSFARPRRPGIAASLRSGADEGRGPA